MSESTATAPASEAPAPAAAAPKKVAAKKSSAAKKPASKPNHPKTGEMVNAALDALKDKKGSSLQAIKKYIAVTYLVEVEKLSIFIKKYLKSAIEKKIIVQTKGSGASGRFKLAAKAEKSSEKKVVKKPVAKKPVAVKKPAGEKKVAAKKPATEKRTTNKMVAAKKSAAVAKKPVAAKKIAAAKVAKAKSPSKAKKNVKAPTATQLKPKPMKCIRRR